MLFGNKQKTILCGLLALSFNVQAENLKDLIVEAITNGKSTGYLDADIVKKFSAQTKSNLPVQVVVERTIQYSQQCAELSVTSIQNDAKTSTGKTGPLNLFFKLPICIDGSYPATLKMADDERKNNEMKACKQSVLKGSVKDGFETGSINFNGCPKNGEIGIFYDGACKELNPGSNSAVKEFKLDTHGTLSIQMLIPQQCLKSGVSNKWQLYFFERRGATYPKEVIGNRSIAW